VHVIGVEGDWLPPAVTALGVVPAVANGVDSYSSNLFIAALVDYLCSLYVTNTAKKDKLFQSEFLSSCNASFFLFNFIRCPCNVFDVIVSP